jgi:broad specificity phosphatase PhoE
MQTIFYLARHGTTTDSAKNIFRGDRDSMLDRKGFNDAHELKEFFADKDWENIFVSNMTRSLQTARIIAGDDRADEVKEPIRNLRPWDIGYLTGKDKKQFSPDMQVFIENPEMQPKDGESLREFQSRINPLLIEGMEIGLTSKPPIVIGHSSVIHALAHLLWGDGHPPLAVKPGGVIEVFVNKKGDIDARSIFKPGKDDSSFAGSKQPSS